MHFKEICKVCGVTISQCRCMDCTKECKLGYCSKCKQVIATEQCGDHGYNPEVDN